MAGVFRNVVLTGACGGLGQALANALIGQGAHVALVGLDRRVLQALAAQAPERCAVYLFDVADSAAMQRMALEWMGRVGVPDLVIANAGVAGGFDPSEAGDLRVMRRMLEINLLGVATTFQPFVTAMRAQHRGTLAGVASIAGWRGMPGNGAYCASKGGLMRYLQSLRAELRRDGVRVCTVSPGYLRTALTAGNRFAMPGLMEPHLAASQMLQAMARGRSHIVLPRRVGWLSHLLSLLPEAWYDALLLRQPRKPRWRQPGATPIPGLEADTFPAPAAPLPEAAGPAPNRTLSEAAPPR